MMTGAMSSLLVAALCLVTETSPPDADVVVVGGTPVGIASAVAAARMGSSVVLLEPTRHVGGIVSNGLTNADILKRQAVGGIFHEFTQRVLAYYRGEYGSDSSQVKACRGGYCYEPKVAERIFLEMLAGQGERIRVYYRHRLKRVVRKNRRVVAGVVENLADKGRQVRFGGKVFVDATYEGDLAAWAGAPYRVGRESRDEHGERHAGVIYARFGKDELLPGSTGEADKGIQAYCFRLFMTQQPENRVPVEKPASYDRNDYRYLFADNHHYPRRMYVRETRRIVGEYVFTERDGDLDPKLGRTRLQPTSIAVAEFPWDSHGVHKYDPKHPGVREGYFYVHHPPAQVPYGVLIPRKVDNLLVPVCCSASHVGYQSLRVEPTYMALGHAAGIAAHLAAALDVPVRDVPVERLQIELVAQRGVITYYDDLPFDDPAFGVFQFLGARGLNPGYRAQRNLKLPRKYGWIKLERILQAMNIAWPHPPTTRTRRSIATTCGSG